MEERSGEGLTIEQQNGEGTINGQRNPLGAHSQGSICRSRSRIG